jgi:hypothetical protein
MNRTYPCPIHGEGNERKGMGRLKAERGFAYPYLIASSISSVHTVSSSMTWRVTLKPSQ